MRSGGLDEQLELIESEWRRLREAVERLGQGGLEATTAAGWTVEEMLAHVAFWEETVHPVVNGMYRGREVPLKEWYGGDDLGLRRASPGPSPTCTTPARPPGHGRVRR